MATSPAGSRTKPRRTVGPRSTSLASPAKAVRARGRAGAPGQLKQVAASRVPSAVRNPRAARRAPQSGGIDLGKFASEVSTNFGKGVNEVSRGLSKVIPSRNASGIVSRTTQVSHSNNAALRKAIGKSR